MTENLANILCSGDASNTLLIHCQSHSSLSQTPCLQWPDIASSLAVSSTKEHWLQLPDRTEYA